MCELSPVAFHGDTIFCFTHNNQPYTPVKPIVENMGLDWGSQSAKLNANKERWTIAMIAIVAQDGIRREMLCLPVRKLPAWLASINPKKVRPELRPKIELYQAECDDALWAYWSEGRAEREPISDCITPDQQCTLQAMVKALVERGGHYANIWSRFNNHFRIARYCQLPQSRMSEAVDYLMRLPVEPKKLPHPTVAENATTCIAGGELLSALPNDDFLPERAAQSVRAARLALQEAFEELSGLSRAYQRKYLHQPGKAGLCFQGCSAFGEQWQCAISALSAALFTIRAMSAVDEL